MTTNVSDAVRGIASDLFSISAGQITDSSSPETVEAWDSTQHLNFVLALEEKFGVQFSPEEMEQMKNIGEVVKILAGKLNGASH